MTALTGDWSIDLTDLADIPNFLERELRKAIATPDLGNPMAAYHYINARRDAVIESQKQRPLIRLWDKHMRYIGDIGCELSVTVDEVMADSGTAQVVLRKDNWLSDFMLYGRKQEEDLHITIDPNPTNRSWRTRWGGKVTEVDIERGEDGLHRVTLNAISNREHAKHILLGANPLLPPEIQFPKMWLFPWNLRTALASTTFINLARQFFPLLSIPTNILNPGAWLGVMDIVGGLDPLAWPIQVQFVNPVFDQSRTSVISSRWNDLHTVSGGPMKDAGVMLRAYTWLLEDLDSPHPELGDIGGALARPHRNCIILAFEDKSGVTGPTGTLLDGPINLIGATADDLITETLVPLDMWDKDGDGKTDPLIRKLLMVAPATPKVIFRDGEYTGIRTAKRSMRGATAKTIMTGSKSPQWVNQLQTFGIKYGLAQLSAVISYGVGAVQATGTPGLDELYQGQLDDTLFAWERFTDPRRAILMGDMGFLEHFEKGSGSAYTISGVLDLRTGHYKTEGKTTYSTTIVNGRPWSLDTHFSLGDRLAFQVGNVLHVDQLVGWRRSYDASKYLEVELTLGGDQDDDDPFAKGMQTLGTFWNFFSSFLGSESMF